MSIPSHKADFSRERRRTAVRYLKAEVPKRAPLSAEALLLLTVGLLICDSRGYMPQVAIESASNDPSVVAAAHELIRKAGL